MEPYTGGLLVPAFGSKSPMSAPLASIIIRCYNEREHIGRVLYGIFQQNLEDFEVIVVDSGSTDGTLEIIEQFPIKEILHIDPKEFSFGRALNYGCKAACGEYFVFTSAHAYPARIDWLNRLLEKFEDEEVALVYGKQRGNEMTKFSEKRIFRKWFPETDIDHQDFPFCNNANAAIRGRLWENCHFDETLTGLEDMEWAKRMQEEGWEVSYASEAAVIHVHDETFHEVYNRYRREGVAHNKILPAQEFKLTDFLTLFLYNTFADCAAAARRGEFPERFTEIVLFRAMQFWGTYRGFNQSKPISENLWQRFFYPKNNSRTSKKALFNSDKVINYQDQSNSD